jgi:predicted RNA binding protein YcfA (HicA-like mRNA interferase family)
LARDWPEATFTVLLRRESPNFWRRRCPGSSVPNVDRGTLLSGTVYGTIVALPAKIRELEARLRKAGFKRQASKGSHRKWVHPTGRFVVMSGREGIDAKRYQEEQVDEAITAVRAAPKP